MKIFYSWQSDLPNKNNRSFIEDCIKKTIKRYKELGGKLISVGSDSHYAERIGVNIDKAYEIARQAGFKSVATFKDRKASEFAIV